MSGRYVDSPATATSVMAGSDDASTALTLPFNFVYFGRSFNSCTACTNGFIQFGGQAYTQWSTVAFNTLNAQQDGMCAPYWDDTNYGAGGAVKHWVDGAAPNRRFIVAWENMRDYYDSAGSTLFTYQVQLFEDGGRIVFAYKPGGTWPGQSGTGQTSAFITGIDAVSPDTRYVVPSSLSVSPNTTAVPSSDFQFDPRITTFTGRISYDRLTVDSSGIGNSVEQNIPLAGLKVELRNASGAAVGSGYADANGDFVVQGSALVGTQSGSLVATAQSQGCVVRSAPAGVPLGFTLATNVSFANNLAIGAIRIDATNDPGGASRASLNIARAIQSAHTWASSRTTAAIPQLEVRFDDGSSAATSYTKAGASPALMVVAGGASGNPDPWDTHVLRKWYARHILAYIAASPTSAVDAAFDKTTDDQNAFAEGFGYYLNAALSLDRNYYDGLSGSACTVLDLEGPTLVTTPGPAVAGSVAAALWDLVDDANEAWDAVDGRGVNVERPFLTVDSLGAPVTAGAFFRAWGDIGFDGVALSTVFIHNGLVPDDADEPNDVVTASTALPQFGFVRTGRVLSLYNEDWYEFTMPASTTALTAQMVYDRLLTTTLVLELLSEQGTVLATGAGVGEYGPVVAAAGALPAGKYRVHVKHTGGVGLATYTLQAFSQLEFTSGEFTPWTVGHDYNVPVAIKGGVPPYILTVDQAFESLKPPGLVYDGPTLRVYGRPSQAGHYNFLLSARDSAIPSNVASGSIDFVVNPELALGFSRFIAIAFGRPIDLKLPYSGGTAPYTIEFIEGVPPSGLAAAPGELRMTGTPDVPGSYPFKVEGTDVAGSSATGSTSAVVCVPFGATPLAMGDAACGFYFDAVSGTTTSLAIKTSKKRAKRPLTLTILDSNGVTEIPASPKNGTGKASLAGFVAPHTGRFFCVVSSGVGEATELAGSGKLTPSKGGSGQGPQNFVAGRTFSVEMGALAGATMSFSAKPDKSGLVLKAAYLLDPAGVVVPFVAGEVTEESGAISVTKVLPTTGTWRFVIGATPGPQGTFTYSFKLKQPKGAVYVQN